MKVPKVPGSGNAGCEQDGGHRLGIGEFTDAGGIMPRLIGRRFYLEAMAFECKTSREELVSIWSPCMSAMQAVGRELKERQEPEGGEPACPPIPPAVEALVAPLESLLGIPLPLILRVLSIGRPGRPISSVPVDSPSVAAANAALLRAFHSHADWMTRWALPKGDVGWCIFTAGMGALWAMLVENGIDDGALTSRANPDEALQVALLDTPRDFAFFDPDKMNNALSHFLGVIQDPVREGLPNAIGSFVADVIMNTRGAAEPIVVPPLSWNPKLETRAGARKRLRAEADRAIAEQLVATHARLIAAQERRTLSKSMGLLHYQWLVRNQVMRKTEQEIANSANVSKYTVHKELLKVRRLVGLNRRRGRPTRSRTESS